MATWRVIETDPDTLTGTDILVSDKDAEKAKPKRKFGNKRSIHLCPHAAGEPASEWYNCKNDPRSQYEEI